MSQFEKTAFFRGFEKKAFIGSIVGAAAKAVGGFVMRNPLRSAFTALTVADGASQASKAFTQAGDRAAQFRNIPKPPQI